MPWPVYTERLLATAVPRTWVSWTVPAGRRAIVKVVSALNSSSTVAMKVHVVMANIYVAAFSIPDAYNSKALDTLAVGYSGDELRAYLEGESGAVLVTGWLLDDPQGRQTEDAGAELLPEWPPPG